MKKGLFVLAFALTSLFCFGQTMHKGALLGLHMFTPNLKDGVTIEAYTKFYNTELIPAYEKAFPGIRMYLIKSIRGQDSSSMGVIIMFDNEAGRNKYFASDGTMTELGKAGNAKLLSMGKEQEKYETSSDAPDKYNDWLVE